MVLLSVGVLLLYVKTYELVRNCLQLRTRGDQLESDIREIQLTLGSLIVDSKEFSSVINTLTEDLQKSVDKVESLETKLKKYEEAAKKVSELQSISPRLARGAHRV